MRKITLLLILLTVSFGYSQNLALSGTASATSELAPASNAIDGNTGTRWESVHGAPGATHVESITIDLGASYDIDQIILNWEGAFADEYTIDISSDNTNWTNIYTTTTGDGGIDDLSVTGTGQYVKMTGLHRFLDNWGYSLWEFEIYEDVDPTADASLSDLTVNGTTVDGFSPNTFVYDISLPSGTTVVPAVVGTPTQSSPATAVTTDASGLPGTSTVLVTAQDGSTTQTYTLNFTVSTQQTFDLTFESGAVGSVASNWNVFENNWNPPLEVVANPDPSGVNTSANVAKMTTLSSANGGAPWAGTESVHGTIWEWELDGTTTTLTIDVYKTEISEVVVKMVNTTSGTVFQIHGVQNTVINAWETLTYDLTSYIASGENHDIDQIVVFPDWQDPRATDNITYFDNISWEGLKTADAPTLGISENKTTEFKVYPNPSKVEWNIKANGQIINSIEVFDVLGKQVVILKPNATDVVIDASTLNKGIYLAKVVSGNSIKTIKLVKN